jgi:tetratricopeptide (TPR) repeat protein
MRWGVFVAVLGVALCRIAPAGAGNEPPRGEPFAFATLENGTFLGFALLRPGTAQQGDSIGEMAFPRSNGVSRVLVDEGGVTYFGYRLEVEPTGKGQFKVTVRPLGSDIEKELRRKIPCLDCPPPRLLAPLLRYPAPRVIADGDVFTLDLLVNPTTQEKIIDLVKVSQSAISAATMRGSAARIAEALLAVKQAEIHMSSGRYEAAVAEFTKAVAIHPNDATIHNKLGTCYLRSQRMGEAEKEYQEALRINPSYAEVWNNLGALQHGRGKYKQAIKNYQQAINNYQKAQSPRPGLATAYKNMGSAYFAIQRFDAGYEAYQAAYRLDPTSLEAPATMVIGLPGESVAMEVFYVAKICAANGQIESALAFLRRASDAGLDLDRVTRDPDFKEVVADPRYQQLVKDVKARTPGR